jgi:hypothetical protein
MSTRKRIENYLYLNRGYGGKMQLEDAILREIGALTTTKTQQAYDIIIQKEKRS